MIPPFSDWGSDKLSLTCLDFDHFGYPLGGEFDLNPYDNIHGTQYYSLPSRLGDLHTIHQDPIFSCIVYSALEFLDVKSSGRGESLVGIRAHMHRGGFERRCISCSGPSVYETSSRNFGGQTRPDHTWSHTDRLSELKPGIYQIQQPLSKPSIPGALST